VPDGTGRGECLVRHARGQASGKAPLPAATKAGTNIRFIGLRATNPLKVGNFLSRISWWREARLSPVGPNNLDRNPDYGAPDSCRLFNITDCTIRNASGTGFLLDDVGRVRVSGCLIQSSQPKPTPPSVSPKTHNLILG